LGMKVLRAGLLTTVQDIGRWGFQHLGVPVAGPMDVFSHRLANALIGNDPKAATLEITLAGPELEFLEDRCFVVAGAAFDLYLDDSFINSNRIINVLSGQCLRFGRRRRGARAYLSVEGGIDVPVFLGSRATHTASRMGGFEGRALRDGDVVSFAVLDETRSRGFSKIFDRRNIVPSGGADVRVLRSPNGKMFKTRTIERLFSGRYIVSTESDRMAFRLQGESLSMLVYGEMLSMPTSQGAIQVPRDGTPIVLMADRQTIGGYPVIGNVIDADLPTLGQLVPGDWVRFEECDNETALRAAILKERMLLSQEMDKKC